MKTRKNFKSMLSIIFSTIFVMSSILTSFASTPQYITREVSLKIEGSQVIFQDRETQNYRIIEFDDSGEHYIVKTNKVSGEITINGKVAGYTTAYFEEVEENNEISLLRFKNTWKLYEEKYGTLAVEAVTVALWSAALASFFNVSVAAAIVTGTCNHIISMQLYKVGTKYEKYYIDPVTTSRPKTANVRIVYSDLNYKKEITRQDGRY